MKEKLANLGSKEKILLVSEELFFTQGFHETGIREIAKKAGLSSGALYKHFADKEAILCEIIEPHIREWWKVCNEELEIFEENIKKLKNKTISFDEFLSESNEKILIEAVEKSPAIWNFIFHNSKGTQYESFIHELVDWEYSVTIQILDISYADQSYFDQVSETSMKFIIRSYFETVFNTFKPDVDGETRKFLIKTISDLYTPFWMNLLSSEAN